MRDTLMELQLQQRQRLEHYKQMEQVYALTYLYRFADKYGWDPEDVEQVALMLGLHEVPSTLTEVPYFNRRGSVARSQGEG